MFEVLIREAGARFGLGDKAEPLLQMLLASMTDHDAGGLPGFLERFKAAGCGPLVQSWLGGGPSAQPIGNSQIEAVLGGGLLPAATARLDVPRDSITSAIGYFLPVIVGKLTPGGSMPLQLPADVLAVAEAGRSLLAAPLAAASTGAGMGRWLPWAVAALLGLGALLYFGVQRPEAVAPAVPPAPAAPAVAPADPAPAPAAVPVGAGVVVVSEHDQRPALTVYFGLGEADMPADFAAQAEPVLAALAGDSTLKAVIAGFNDPSGDAAANAELAKRRAQAVQAALAQAGVAPERTVLEKPAETTGTGADDASSRRVEVVLRP